MTSQKSLGSFLPRQLIFILVAIVPVAFACNTLSHLHDPHPAPETMTPEAIGARLQPIAHTVPVAQNASSGPMMGPLAMVKN
jgi:hypothetical protein